MIQRKIYISGGISGHPLEERRAVFARAVFARAEEELRSRGYVPVNPFNNGVSLDAPYEDHMRTGLRMLLECAGIYLLHGWMSRRGACLEHDVAVACGMEIIDEFGDDE